MAVDAKQAAPAFHNPLDKLRTAPLGELDALVAQLVRCEPPHLVEEAFARRIGVSSLEEFHALRDIWRRYF